MKPPYRAALDRAAAARAARDDRAMARLYAEAAIDAARAGAEMLAFACQCEADWAQLRILGGRPPLPDASTESPPATTRRPEVSTEAPDVPRDLFA